VSNLMEGAYRHLTREIIELKRPPGTSFTEQQVAVALGLSKTPVREALARLHRDGFVRPLPRAGYIVAPVTLGDAAELCELRRILQPEAAALCAAEGLTPEMEARLSELADHTSEEPLVGPALENMLRAMYEFEAIIGNGSRNQRLAAAVARLLDDLERVIRLVTRIDPSVPASRLKERRDVVDAIIARDPDAARAAMTLRAAAARDDILGKLASSSSVTSAAILVP